MVDCPALVESLLSQALLPESAQGQPYLGLHRDPLDDGVLVSPSLGLIFATALDSSPLLCTPSPCIQTNDLEWILCPTLTRDILGTMRYIQIV